MIVLEQYIKELLEARWNFQDMLDGASGDFEDFYGDPPNEQEIKMHDHYFGRNVIWLGQKGRMLKVPASELTPREDNIFDFDKVAAVRDYIINAEDRVYFEAPPAQIVVVDLQLIREMQHAKMNDRLESEYGISQAYSLDDEELDLFLVSPKDWVEENLVYGLSEIEAYIRGDLETVYKELVIDPTDWEEDERVKSQDMEGINDLKQDVDQYLEMKNQIDSAEEEGLGDIGEYWVDLRDGNHRAFGAIAAGEPYVWVLAVSDRTDDSVELD